MLGKNNHYLRRLREGEKITHYTIKKLSVGVASVAVGSFIMLNSGQAYAAEPASVQPATAHTQAESSDGTAASQESSVSEQAAVLSASSQEASLVSAEAAKVLRLLQAQKVLILMKQIAQNPVSLQLTRASLSKRKTANLSQAVKMIRARRQVML